MKTAVRNRPQFVLAIALLLPLVLETQARGLEVLSRHLPGEPIMRRSAILRQQSDRIAIMLDTTRQVRDVLDSLLGWRYKAGYATKDDHVSIQGLRARRLYDTLPKPGVLRLAAFGDSFVYGNEVSDSDAWCAVLESRDSDLEVLNYGVGGYGLDQAFLRFQHEGMIFHPDVVLIVFVPDDLRRVVNIYRRFISTLEFPLSKPRFIIRADAKLALVPTPLPNRASFERLMQHPDEVRSLGRLDAWYPRMVYESPLYDDLAMVRVGATIWRWLDRRFLDPRRLTRGDIFNDRSNAFAVQLAVMDAFASAVRAAGATPVIVMLPDRGSLLRVHRGGEAVYAPLRDSLLGRGLAVWDGVDAFRSVHAPVESLYAPYLHYSPLGNRVVAEWLANRLDPLRAAHTALLRHEKHPNRAGSSGA